MSLVDHLAARFGVTPGTINPQKRVTSRHMRLLDGVKVQLLTGPFAQAAVYTQMGKLAKRQPKPFKASDIVYAKLQPNGLINLYPFALAGSGYEFLIDAEEGVHYKFV